MSPPDLAQSDQCDRPEMTRRQVLMAGGTTVLTAVAGCASVVDTIADQVLEDVNIFNELPRTLGGSVDVRGPAGSTALAETFDLPSADSDEESNFVAYDDVWATSGAYEVTVDLDTTVEGASRASVTVSIDDTESEMVGVALGSDETDEPIAIRVGESLSAFTQNDRS